MKAKEAPKSSGRLLALDVRVFLTSSKQFVVRGERGVVLQNVKDEPLLNGLVHRVAVNWLAAAPEHCEGLVLWSRSEGKEAQVGLLTALRHAAEELFHILPPFLGRA